MELLLGLLAPLIRWALPWALLVGGPLLAWGCLDSAFRPPEPEPTSVELSALLASQRPAARHLVVTGGVLYWPGRLVRERSARRAGGAPRLRSWHVPLLTLSEALAHESDGTSPAACAYVEFDAASVRELFPDGLPQDPIQPFEPVGTLGTAALERGPFRAHLESAGVPPREVPVLFHGDAPLGRREAVVGLSTGVLGYVIGVLWVRRRWKRRKASRVAVSVS